MRDNTTKQMQIYGIQTQAGTKIPGWASDEQAKAQVPRLGEPESHPLKSPFDVLLALLGLVISFPLWLVVAIAIKLEDRGPIFFVQERWGKDKSKIQVYKFRTMVPDAMERFGHIQASENDPRVTRVGRLLRATSLDEMPQLLNILKGDMSWVGPRALAIDEVQVQENGDHSPDSEYNLPDTAIPGFGARAKLRPGLTGIAQIFAPRDIPRRQKYQYDALYANSQNLWLDIRLIFFSLWITLRARWETRESKF